MKHYCNNAAILACANCQGLITRSADALSCPRCGRVGEYHADIPRFSSQEFYWGEIPRQQMQELNEQARRVGWRRAISDGLSDDNLRSYISSPHRADFHYLWQMPDGATVLDVGAGLGGISAALAGSGRFARVVALEAIWERADFIQSRATEDDLAIDVICADFLNPPLALEQFDAIVLNGVLEWAALNTDGDPRDTQLAFLKRILGLLKPGGLVCLGIENRVGAESFRGALDHSGLPYTSLMPRRLASYWCSRTFNQYRSKANRGYRTYTYSLAGYQKLLREAGFIDTQPYHAWDGYNSPTNLLPLNSRGALSGFIDLMDYRQNGRRGMLKHLMLKAGVATGLWSVFASEFTILSRKDLC